MTPSSDEILTDQPGRRRADGGAAERVHPIGYARRRSYGADSPTVGERGARTRQRLLDAALACFVDRGFHATSIDEITGAADTARATLYQYFENKQAMFIELMYDSGRELNRITSAIGRLGPDAGGYRNLSTWVGNWSANFDRFAPMFVEWTNVAAPEAPIRGEIVRFADRYGSRLGALIADHGAVGADPASSALLVLALLSRYNYIRYLYRPALTEEEHHAALAESIQLFLFPDTPDEVLREARRPVRSPSSGGSPVAGPFASLPGVDSSGSSDAFCDLSPRAAGTVRRLLDAAAAIFAANGYEAANIDQVVAEAGVARGTFYRYFANKLDLFLALSHEVTGAMVPMFERFPDAVGEPTTRDEWLVDFLELQRVYVGVLRGWTEQRPSDPGALVGATRIVAAMADAIERSKLGATPRVPPTAAGMLLVATIENFPSQVVGTIHEPTDEVLIATESLFIERALLSR